MYIIARLTNEAPGVFEKRAQLGIRDASCTHVHAGTVKFLFGEAGDVIRWRERRNGVLMAGGVRRLAVDPLPPRLVPGVNWSEAQHAAGALWRPGGRTAALRTTLKSP